MLVFSINSSITFLRNIYYAFVYPHILYGIELIKPDHIEVVIQFDSY